MEGNPAVASIDRVDMLSPHSRIQWVKKEMGDLDSVYRTLPELPSFPELNVLICKIKKMVAEFVRTVMDVMSRESPPRGEDCQCIYRLRVEITGVFDELKAKMADLRLPEAEDQARVDDGDQNSNPATGPTDQAADVSPDDQQEVDEDEYMTDEDSYYDSDDDDDDGGGIYLPVPMAA